jgi:hypothetical protein
LQIDLSANAQHVMQTCWRKCSGMLHRSQCCTLSASRHSCSSS